MATIREYFDTDIKTLALTEELSMQSGAIAKNISAKIAADLEANAKYWSFYFPFRPTQQEALAVLSRNETKACTLTNSGLEVEMGFSDYSERSSSTTLCYTQRVFFYVDAQLDPSSRKDLADIGKNLGFELIVRDSEYARKRSETETPLAFISHDSRDKESFVRQLALEMTKLYCPVWYDEYTLRVGDSVMQKIDTGLKKAKHCVIVLSPSFLQNNGWGRAEYESIFTREIIEKRNVILPVWHGVTKEEIFEYSSRLADRFALSSQLGVEEVARQLVSVIRSS